MNKILVVLMILLILGMAGGGVYLYYTGGLDVILNAPQPYIPIDPEQVASSNTLPYKSDTCKVSLMYPSNWQTVAESEKEGVNSFDVSKDNFSVHVECGSDSVRITRWASFESKTLKIGEDQFTRTIFYKEEHSRVPFLAIAFIKPTESTTSSTSGNETTGSTSTSSSTPELKSFEDALKERQQDQSTGGGSGSQTVDYGDYKEYVFTKNKIKYVITYLFPAEFDNRTVEGIDKFDKYLTAMDKIVQSITFSEQ